MNSDAFQDGRPLRCRSALFGEYLLVPHAADQEPTGRLLGYVLLEGDDTLHHAVRIAGGWRGERNRPFTRQIVAWYSLDQLDGTPLF